tara:strand:+ start:162784 stop:165057 length:2274 start_codon:yes stop_codon:yes gene_type:complete
MKQLMFMVMLLSCISFGVQAAYYAGSMDAPIANPNLKTLVTVDTKSTPYNGLIHITVSNASDQAIDLNKATINFTSPYSVWSASASSTSPNMAAATIAPITDATVTTSSITFNAIQKGQTTSLAPNTTFTETFTVSTNNKIATSDQFTNVGVFTAGPPPTNPGVIVLTAPAKPSADAGDDATAEVKGPNGYDKNNIKVTWQGATNVTNLADGTYTVITNAAGSSTGAKDQTVTLSATQQTANATLAYLAPVPPAVLNVTMPAIPATNAPQQTVMLDDVTTGTSGSSMSIAWSATAGKINLRAGDTYHVWAPVFQYNGNEYTPSYTQAAPLIIKVSQQEPSMATFSYHATAVATINATLNVTGLPDGATSTYTFTKGLNDTYSYTLGNGENPIKVAAGEYNIAATDVTVAGKTYRAAVKNPYTIAEGGKIDMAFNPPLNKLMVGYLDITAISSADVVISQLAQLKTDGYNTVVFAFADVNGNAMVPHANTQKYYQDVATAKQMGFKVLISVGGEINTFNPGAAVDWPTLAKNMAAFVAQYDFDGIDFDLEIPMDTGSLDTLLKAIRVANPKLLLTAAPQLNYVNDTDGVQLVSTGTSTIYNTAVANGDFDALFVQAYNTGGYAIDEVGNSYATIAACQASGAKSCADETSASFIDNSFQRLKKIVPASTQIVMGEPSDAVAAGAGTIYHPSGSTLTVTQVTPKINAQVENLLNDAQFGGIMTWSLNVDYDPTAYNAVNHPVGAFGQGVSKCVISGACQ